MPNLYQYPLPPQNYIAEELLLGIILIYPNILTNIISFIKVDYFFLECHQIIYMHVLALYKKNKIQPIELLYSLSDKQILYEIGGIYKIIDIMKQAQIFIPSTNLNIYIQELIELINTAYIKRLMIQYGQNIIQLAYIKQISNYKLYNKASSYLYLTEKQIPKQNINNFQNLITTLLLKIKYPQKQTKHKNIKDTILQSGFQDIDNLILGLHDGDLIVIAGRPSMGKTSLVINLAWNILNDHKIGICFFSLEMSSQQILQKFIAISCNISIQDIILNKLDKAQWHQIKNTCKKMLDTYIYINDHTNLSIDYIEYTSKLLKKENPDIKLIIVDYLQLIETDCIYSSNRVQELSYITRKLKLLAQYLQLPVVVLSQLNRNIETRINKQPILSDLKESGCVNYKESISINSHHLNNIKIFNMIFHYGTEKQIYKTIHVNKCNYYLLYHTSNVGQNIFCAYIFCNKFTIYYPNKIEWTYQHKYLKNYIWIETCHSIINAKITTLVKNCLVYKKYLICYITNIVFAKYNIVYDLNINQTFTFTCNNIILHNSIEQDADIVLMLYKQEKEKTENSSKNNQIFDVILGKNRNGPIGSCQLFFASTSTRFSSHNDMNKLI
uniref:Replicative DNA helicase n=1 Tax=Bornetia secundiflora TaxID=2575637 RepID=A0A4D6WMR5_9FLOR|nr:replication helicase subunit [Bornetia secundiflora]